MWLEVIMKVKYSVSNNKLKIYYFGELDECTSQQVKKATDDILSENISVNEVIFNLSNLKFMDSTGIGMLLGRYKKITSTGKRAFIENPTPTVDKVFQISGIYDVMPKI